MASNERDSLVNIYRPLEPELCDRSQAIRYIPYIAAWGPEINRIQRVHTLRVAINAEQVQIVYVLKGGPQSADDDV